MEASRKNPFGKITKSIADLFGKMAMAVKESHLFRRMFFWMPRRGAARGIDAEAPLKDPAASRRRKKAPKTDGGLAKTAGSKPRYEVGRVHVEKLHFEAGATETPPFHILCVLDGVASPVKFAISTAMPVSVISLSCVERCGLLDRLDRHDRCGYTDYDYRRKVTCGTLHVPAKTVLGYPVFDKVSVVETLCVDAILGTDFLNVKERSFSFDFQNQTLTIFKGDLYF